MKKKKNLEGKQSNLKLVFLFCLFIGLLIIGSIIFKAIFLVMKSKFDVSHRFTIAVETPDPKTNGKSLTIYSYAPDTKDISVLHLIGKASIAGTTVGKYLGIPVDAQIVFNRPVGDGQAIENIFSDSQNSPDGVISRAFFHYYDLKTSLTEIDLFRLFLFAKSIPSHAITEKDIPIDSKGRLPDGLTVDKIIAPLFIDAALAEEKMSIQIINGADAVGLANRLGRVLINMGANVVAVSTSDSIVPKSVIQYVGDKSYTVERLAKTLGIPAQEVQKTGISDIIIKLGKDNANPKSF